MIRHAQQTDAGAIARIYNWYIEHTIVTFEEQALSAAEMALRLATADDQNPWLLMEEAGQIVGYAYASVWNTRAAYRLTRTTTIYLQQAAIGAGRGITLYQHLIDEMRNTPIHVLIAGISLPNPASVALHEKLGFQHCGQFPQVGRKFNNYIDVGYWQLIL